MCRPAWAPGFPRQTWDILSIHTRTVTPRLLEGGAHKGHTRGPPARPPPLLATGRLSLPLFSFLPPLSSLPVSLSLFSVCFCLLLSLSLPFCLSVSASLPPFPALCGLCLPPLSFYLFCLSLSVSVSVSVQPSLPRITFSHQVVMSDPMKQLSRLETVANCQVSTCGPQPGPGSPS